MTTPGADGNRARIVLTANNSIGSGSAGDTAANSIDRKALTRVAKYCSDNSADALLIAGNLFDSPAPSPDCLLFVAGALADLRKAGVVVGAICGDADMPTAGRASAIDLFARLGLLANLDKVAVSDHFPLRAGPLTIAVSSLPRAPKNGADGGLLGSLDRRKPANFHILLSHAAVEGTVGARTAGPVINVDAIRALVGVDALVCGQSHASRGTALGDTAVIMPGSPFGARSECGFVRLNVSPKGIEDLAVIEGLAREITEIRIPASELAGGGLTVLKRAVESRLLPGAEVRVSIAGRLDIESFRQTGLAELSQWASKRCARFVIDLSGLRVQAERNGVDARESISPFDEARRTADALADAGRAENGAFAEASELLLKSLRAEFGS